MGFNQIKVELVDFWGKDRTVAHSAWASSTDQEKLSLKTDIDIKRIVTNVVSNHHDTPKERVWVEFFITCPIYVERQFDKYRLTIQYQDFQVEFLERPMGGDHITQNELSGRYRTIPDRSYVFPKDIVDIYTKQYGVASKYQLLAYQNVIDKQHEIYQSELDSLKDAEKEGKISNAEYKRAREVLRGILGTAYLTDMRISMNLNAFEHIMNQRLAKDTQTESRVVAYRMLQAMKAAGVAEQTVLEMSKVNGWDALVQEIELIVANDSV